MVLVVVMSVSELSLFFIMSLVAGIAHYVF